MAAAITALEFIVGSLTIKYAHIRLWDYTECFGNIKGIICPLYSFFWIILSALYYFFIHSHIIYAFEWLSRNLAFSFGVGFFYGIFVIDLCYSAQIIVKIRKYADEKQIIIRLERLREEINYNLDKHKPRFLLSFKTELPLNELLEKYAEKLKSELKH